MSHFDIIQPSETTRAHWRIFECLLVAVAIEIVKGAILWTMIPLDLSMAGQLGLNTQLSKVWARGVLAHKKELGF